MARDPPHTDIQNQGPVLALLALDVRLAGDAVERVTNKLAAVVRISRTGAKSRWKPTSTKLPTDLRPLFQSESPVIRVRSRQTAGN